MKNQLLLACMAIGTVPAHSATPALCGPGWKGGAQVGLQEVSFSFEGYLRKYLFYSPPATMRNDTALSLVFLAPGTNQPPIDAFEMSSFAKFAIEKRFAVAVLSGDRDLLNVQLHGQAGDTGPDDVRYVKEIMTLLDQLPCVDGKRVFCAGYSRGARFCSRLASEMSETMQAIAAVGGLRFPVPNNATRPVPTLAFHGVEDPINPYAGRGNPSYWHGSVPSAVNNWASFNKCRRTELQIPSLGVEIEKHGDCSSGADVVLVSIRRGGHTWPGSSFEFDDGLGRTSRTVDASAMILDFFAGHRSDSTAQSENRTQQIPSEDMPIWRALEGIAGRASSESSWQKLNLKTHGGLALGVAVCVVLTVVFFKVVRRRAQQTTTPFEHQHVPLKSDF